MLTNIDHDQLKAYIIWLPIFPGDSRKQALNRSSEFTDDRLRYFWDENHIAAKQWQSVLDIERVAWDIYFLYDAEAEWQDTPTEPDFWMHQLTGIAAGPFLDPEKFESKTRQLLKNLD